MTRFIYIYDTLCDWCYGAAPVIDALTVFSIDHSLDEGRRRPRKSVRHARDCRLNAAPKVPLPC
ncbi:hypothetical protein TRM7615_01602 [Falsiruegeria mediterranea M17]|uniref:DSBA-like thioredoxin domain-containing protein n=1 Tax=Falsiruegeria mediterranea M17 TaxID=1200281 RepID=A0A2R8C6W6_9RHOB|nr:hypothetical protein TRM7615_01602 [Falsiruegeria mediterranea M17]